MQTIQHVFKYRERLSTRKQTSNVHHILENITNRNNETNAATLGS